MLACLIAVAGSLGDQLGRVRIFKVGIIIFSFSSLLCGIATNIEQLIIFRTLQGIGGALMIPGSLSIIAATFSEFENGRAIGIWTAATTIVTVGGPVLGGTLADMGLWRFVFFINLPLGIVSFLILQFKVPESYNDTQSGIDWLGAISLALSLALLTYGLLELPKKGIEHFLVAGSLLLGLVLLVAFIIIESRVKGPMIPLSLFRNRTFSGVNLLTFFLYAGLGAIILFLPLNLIQVQGYSQTQAGLTFLPFSFLIVVTSHPMGKLTDRFGAQFFLIVGPALTGVGMLGLSTVGVTSGVGDFWTTFFPWFMVFAAGMSLTVVPLTAKVMNSVDQKMSGVASGINNSITRIAGTFITAIGGALAIYLFTNYVSQELSDITTFSNEQKSSIMAQTENLGDAQVPAHLNEVQQELVTQIYHNGFVEAYQVIMIVGGVMAILSSIVAVFMVRD